MSVVLILDIKIDQIVLPLNLTHASIIKAIDVSIHSIAYEDWNELNKDLTVGRPQQIRRCYNSFCIHFCAKILLEINVRLC